METVKAKPAMAWPATVAACHRVLQHLHAQYQTVVAGLVVANEAVQELTATQTQQRREAEEVDNFLSVHRHLTIEDIALKLMRPQSLPNEYVELKAALPTMHSRLEERISNQYDKRVVYESLEKQQKRQQRKQLKLHRLMCDELRAENAHLYFCLTLARSICIEHRHPSKAAYAELCREQVVVSKSALKKAKRRLTDWIPPTSFETSDDLILCSIDNLDMYARKTHSRMVNGQLVESKMIHAVVTERMLFDKRILQGPRPTRDMLIKDAVSVVKHSALPSREQAEQFLRGKWRKHFHIASTVADPMALLARPPSSCDRQKAERTVCVSLPILTNRSTASKVDVTAAITSVKQQFPGKKLILVMDYQTFAVSWWVKMRQSELFEDVIVVGDELHRQFHTNDCIYRLFWKYVIEPAAMWLHRKDIRQAFSADKYNNKEKFVRLLTTAGLIWLSKLKSEEPIPEDPKELINDVKRNLPVWEFISFLFYAGTFCLSDKEAMRTAHVSELDYAWGYTSILARACGKTNYAKYGVLMNLVLHSTHQWVRNVLDHFRTYRGSGKACTGMGLGTSIENAVKDHKDPIVHPTDANLSAVNVAMTAKREVCRHYDGYLGLKPPKSGKAIVMDEDIELLVETFNICFGSKYSEIKSTEEYSNFANRRVVESQCGASELDHVWVGIPKWVESLTTTQQGREPLVFEPPDVDDPTFIDLTADDSGDDEGVVLGGSGGGGSDLGIDLDPGGGDSGALGEDVDSWARRAANQWLKTHPCGSNEEGVVKARRNELEKLFNRSSRGRALAARRAREARRQEEVEAEDAIARVARAEAREGAEAQVDWQVEEVRGKWVDNDGAVYYRIKWLDFDSKHNTWERMSNLVGSEMLITKFEGKFKSCKNPVVSIHQYTQTGRKRRQRK